MAVGSGRWAVRLDMNLAEREGDRGEMGCIGARARCSVLPKHLDG
jgi:hypothetical protein